MNRDILCSIKLPCCQQVRTRPQWALTVVSVERLATEMLRTPLPLSNGTFTVSECNNGNKKMYVYHALINALNAHMLHINLNMMFCMRVEHSPTKTICITTSLACLEKQEDKQNIRYACILQLFNFNVRQPNSSTQDDLVYLRMKRQELLCH